MQERAYAIVLVVILAICCLGLYVAVSGYRNSINPVAAPASPAAPATLLVVVLNTDTPEPTRPQLTAPPPTSAPIPSPLGAFQTITSAATIAVPRGASPTVQPASPPAALSPAPVPTVGVQSCSGFTYCPGGGPPDPQLAPTGDPCPRNYIWGRVVDMAGRGLPDVQIRFRGPLGNMDRVTSKGPPDPPGIYNILAPPPGGNWTMWVLDAGGGQASPQVSIVAPVPYAGTGNCLTRVDFKAQR